MKDDDRVRVSLDEICLGATCKFEICDDHGILLLAKGRPLTASVRDQFQNRNVSFISVHPDDVQSLLGGSAEQKPCRPNDIPDTLAGRRIDRRSEPYSTDRAKRFTALIADSLDSVTQIGEQIQSLSVTAVSALCDIPKAMTEMAVEDPDQSIAALNELTELSVAQRCTRMAVLAMNIGVELNLTDAEIIHLGTAGLMHDMGLYLLPEKFRSPTIALSSEEAWEFRKHPTFAMDTFAVYSLVPDEICLIMNQVHERADGSGYPRGLHVNLIHPLARVLNLVDSYLSLIDPGPGRPAILPHDAIGFLLHEGARGLFEVMPIQALLTTITLFPIGSGVELDDGRKATVIRRDGANYAAPIVHLEGEAASGGFAIQDSPHQIARPLVDKRKREMRILPDMMESLTLEMLQQG